MTMLAFLACLSAPGDGATAGEIRSYSTIHSIGIEWDLEGDANHNASCKVQYRVRGQPAWKEAMPLLRVDYSGWYAETKADRAYNMLAGSLLFLEPATPYEVRLDLADPEGGSTSRTVAIATRPVPKLGAGPRTFHVVPGAEERGGQGTKEDPFRGLKSAQAQAKPGDLFLLAPGRYGAFPFQASGEAGKYVAWKGTGEVVFDSAEVYGSHVWLEGLAFRKVERDIALKGQGAARDVVVSRCTFLGYQYSVNLNRLCEDWTVSDNVIEGSEDPIRGDLSGEGVELANSSGHVVCYNRISRVADGISYCLRNCDIYGNDIFDVSDDGLEPDYGYANNRMWGNRLTNCKNAALSFQPMYCGPWYFIRNQIVGAGHIFKFRVQDRFVLANNTFVTWGSSSDYMHHLLTSLSRNNLYIYAGPERGREAGALWNAIYYRNSDRYVLHPPNYAAGWMTDVDYDGFDWGASKAPFSWEGGKRRFADLAELAAGVGIEKHALRVRKEEIFETYSVPELPARVEPFTLTLKAGSSAVDAGVGLPNLVEDFAGRAPDLGANESGRAPAAYGPRP
jgi:hypothetical protein